MINKQYALLIGFIAILIIGSFIASDEFNQSNSLTDASDSSAVDNGTSISNTDKDNILYGIFDSNSSSSKILLIMRRK